MLRNAYFGNWYNPCVVGGMAALLVFYRNFALPCSLISLANCIFLYEAGTALYLLYSAWLKLLATMLIGVYVYVFRHQQFYFFHNLGYTKLQLFATAFAIDIISWIALSFTILLIV